MKVLVLFVTSLLAFASTYELTYNIPNVNSWFISYLAINDDSRWVNKSRVVKELTTLAKDPDLLQYYLWTKDNPTTEQRIILGDSESLQKSNFNKSNPTRIMVHGIRSSHNSEVCTLIRDVYLQKGPHNFICLDWSKIAYKSVPTSRFAIPSIGHDLGTFIEFLNKAGGISNKNLILIAHSYGTHIAGHAGKYLKKINNTLPLIVVCDPAHVLFLYEDCSSRICNTDGDFVLSIQTTAGTVGFSRPIGDGAYYPNGGRNQPGCPADTKNYLCGHLRSYQFFAEAVAKNDFPTMNCKTYKNALNKRCGKTYSSIKMGSEESFATKGIFYVPVNSEPPYGKGS